MRPEIADLSNVDPDGHVISGDDKRMVYHSGNQKWHTCMLHRGRAWDYSKYRRVMHRTTVAGEGPTA